MGSTVKLQIGSWTTGNLQPAAEQPRSPSPVQLYSVKTTAQDPLPGGVALSEVMAELESDREFAGHLAEARRGLAPVLSDEGTLRSLRLRAGLSQSALAKLVDSYQPYIARLEAGTVDPGTDMLVRLATALDVTDIAVFAAVRATRESSNV